jgi:hypothetical protein
MDISSVSNSSLDDQVIQSLSPSASQPKPSADTSLSASAFSSVLQTLQSNDLISNNNLAMLQALQGAQTSATGSTASSSPTGTTVNALQELQETNTESNDIFMLQSLQTTYSSNLSNLLQNIQNTEATGDTQQMLEALQAAANGTTPSNSDTGDVLNTLLDPTTNTNAGDNSDPILDSLISSAPDPGSSASTVLQDALGTDSSNYATSPDDAVLQALLQTDTNGGDFARTLQALQNNQNTTSSNTQQVSS